MRNAPFFVVCGLWCTLACGQVPPAETAQPSQIARERAARQAQLRFGELLDRFAALDRERKFEPAVCSELGREFEELALRTRGAARAHALYNSGLAFRRCGIDDRARAAFARSKSHQAQVEIALLDLARGADAGAVIARLQAIVLRSKFADPRALVALASLQMQRGKTSDVDAAKSNLQRALAIDDRHAPAHNQLALLYLSLAKRDGGSARAGLVLAGTERRAARRQTLDLAALVTSQAISRSPNHAALHNTAGLIQVELGEYNAAVQSFRRARELDPRSFEAHMNYGAVSLSLRGFAEAEAAYRAALTLSPRDYDAHLGVALALRGRSKAGDPRVERAREHLHAARRIAPERPEAYYNEAILTEELVAKGVQGKAAIPSLRRAQELYRQFSQRARPSARYAVALERAAQKSGDIDALIAFLESS